MADKKKPRYTSLPKGSGVLGPELKKTPLNWDVGLTIASVATLPLGGPAVAAGLRGALGASRVGARVLASPGSKYLASQVAAGVPKSRVLAGMARNTARGITTRGGSGVGKATRATGSTARTSGTAAKTTKAVAPKGNQYPNLPRTGRKTATGKPYTTAEMRTVAAASKGNYRLAAGAAAVGGVLALGKIPVSSSADSRFTHQAQYRPMTAKPPYKNPMPQWALDGAGRRDNSYKGTYVGSTISKPKSKAPSSTPSSTNGGDGGRPRQVSPAKGGRAKINRTGLVKERLRLAEERAARGDVAGAAAYANAALTIQRKGKGTAASMRRVENVASTYSQKAAAGRPTVKRKKG